MKIIRFVNIALCFVCLVVLDAHSVLALTNSQPIASLQEQSYTTEFTHSGVANVAAHFFFNNLNRENLTSYVLKLPEIRVYEIEAYQLSSDGRIVMCRTQQEDNSLRINLVYPVAQGAQGSIVLLYTTSDYTKRDIFGVYSYTFKPLLSKDKVSRLSAGVQFENGLFLKDGKPEQGIDISELSRALQEDQNGYLQTPTRRLISQLGTGYYSDAINADSPAESFRLNGTYADAKMRFNLSTLVALLVSLAVVSVLVLILSPDLRKRVLIFRLNSITVGLTSTIGILAYTILLLVYDSSGVLILIGSVIIYVLLLICPVVFMSIKNGLKSGVSTAVTIVVVLLLCFSIYWLSNQTTAPIPFTDDTPVLILPFAPILRLL